MSNTSDINAQISGGGGVTAEVSGADSINATIIQGKKLNTGFSDSKDVKAQITGSKDVEGKLSVSGATNFLQLLDVPDTYSGESGKKVVVKQAEDGLAFTSSSDAIDNLSDVSISSVSGGDGLVYNSGSNLWENVDVTTEADLSSHIGVSDAHHEQVNSVAPKTVGNAASASGNKSIALGENTTVNGDNSIVYNPGLTFNGDEAVILGSGNSFTNDNQNFIIGKNNSVSSFGSKVIGSGNDVAFRSTAIGTSCIAQLGAVAIGEFTEATNGGFALGSNAIGTAPGAIGIGENASATVPNAIAIGKGANVTTKSGTVIGRGGTAAGQDSAAFNASTANADDSAAFNGVTNDLAGSTKMQIAQVTDRVRLNGVSSDPSNLQNGDVWYRSDLDEFRVQKGGNKHIIDTTQV